MLSGDAVKARATAKYSVAINSTSIVSNSTALDLGSI